MGLTKEQQERIRQNRERALELRKRKLEDEEEKKNSGNGVKANNKEISDSKRKRKEDASKAAEDDNEDSELEAFEEGASEYVTKQEAMKMYCLPAGTLEVCSFIEKPNPRNGAWNPMKLYNRCEIRRRARKRFGGLEGLIAERRMREETRFQKDMERTKDVFR
jgi:XPA protein C-terminus